MSPRWDFLECLEFHHNSECLEEGQDCIVRLSLMRGLTLGTDTMGTVQLVATCKNPIFSDGQQYLSVSKTIFPLKLFHQGLLQP